MTVAALREARHLPEDALRRAQGQPDAILAPVLAAIPADARIAEEPLISDMGLDNARGEAFRRLREAQFVAIVTPSVKHITTELARGV